MVFQCLSLAYWGVPVFLFAELVMRMVIDLEFDWC